MDKNILEIISRNSKDKQAEKELTKLFSELTEQKDKFENYLALLESATRSDYDSILITDLNLEEPGPEIVYVNEGFSKMTGYSRDEVIGKTPRILQGEKTDRAVLDKLKQRLNDGKSFFGHTVNYRKDGSEFINQWDIHPLTDSKGEVTHWVSFQHDITERKRSEKKVMDAEIEFDKLPEESLKILIDVDEQGNIITSNKAFRDLTGYDDDELKKLSIWEIAAEEFKDRLHQKFEGFRPSDFDDVEFNIDLENKKGNVIETDAVTRLLRSNGQNIVRITFHNKSLQKRIMSTLAKRSISFNRVFDSSVDFNYKILPLPDGTFQFDYVTENFSKITGITTAEVSDINLSDIIHKEDFDKIINHFNVVLQGKPNTEQYRLKKITGDYIEVIDYARPEWDADETSIIAIKGATSTEISSEKKS